MADVFHLGFDIDTSPLARAGTAAKQAADQIVALGDAENKASAASDKMAAGSKKAAQEAENLKKATQGAAGATNDANKAKEQMAQKAAAAADKLKALTQGMQQNSAQTSALIGLLRGQGGLVQGVEASAGVFGKLIAQLGPVGVAVAGAAVGVGALALANQKLLVPLAEAQDQMALFNARLVNALGSSSAAKTMMNDLYTATQKTGLGFRETADAYLRLARNADSLGASKDQIRDLTDVVQKLGAVSGASRGEIGSGMLQLSQALASGRLNGDELRSIMENMPALAKAIADNLGVGVGQLRTMGAAGELSGDKVFQALLRASGKANEEFSKLPDTVERANQRSADAWDRLLATLGQKWNASKFVADTTNYFADLVNKANAAITEKPIGSQLDVLNAKRAKFAALPGVDAQRQVASIDAQITALQAKARNELSQSSDANQKEERGLAFAPIKRAIELGGNEYDDFNKKLKKTTEDAAQLDLAVGNIQIRMKTGVAEFGESGVIPALKRQAMAAKAELYDLLAGLDRAKRDLNDARIADKIGGGGGGSAIVSTAQKQLLEAQKKGLGGTLGDFIGVGIGQAVLKGGDMVDTLERQTAANQKYASAVGRSRSEMRELEVQTESATKRSEMFGKLTNTELEKFMLRYAAALRKSKEAVDELANAQARLGLSRQIEDAASRTANAGNPFAQRQAQLNLDADRLSLTDPEQAALRKKLFRETEMGSAEEQLVSLRRSTANSLAMSARGLSPAEERRLQLEQRITDASRNVIPEKRDEIAQAMREEDAAKLTAEYAAQERSLERQLGYMQQRQSLVGLGSEELRVQSAVLKKMQELQEKGASDDVIARQVALTAEIERQAIAYEKMNRFPNMLVSSFENAADSIGNALQSALEESLSKGTKAGVASFSSAMRGIIVKLGAELTYEIGIRPFVEAMKNAAIAFGKSLLTRFFGSMIGGGGGGGSAAYGAPPAFTGAPNYATGGIFTNSIVSSPTLFAFANGGKLGVMGEAGPEAIMPLKRGADGRLGVAGGGGGVTVVVQDMRSGKDSAPVETSSTTGPDGQRMIQIMVRDEVKRAVRSGELDSAMQSSYGVSRTVARR